MMLAWCRTHCSSGLWSNPQRWQETSGQVCMLSLEQTPACFKTVTMSPCLANPHCFQQKSASLSINLLLNVSLMDGRF